MLSSSASYMAWQRRCIVLAALCLVGFSFVALADDPFRPSPQVNSPYPYRTWTDSTGKNTVDARFVSATGNAVTIQRRDGSTVAVPLTRISQRDRGYIEGIAAALSVAPAARVPDEPAEPSAEPPRPRPRTVAKQVQPIKPYTGDAKEIDLPDTVGDVSLAAGGRLLLLHLPKTKKVAVYDVNEAKITKFMTLSSESARIVGGLTKMIVVAPNNGVIERWSLETFEKETTRPLPFEGVFKTMAMGYAVDGPLMIHWAASTDALARSQYQLFETGNFKSLEYEIRGRNSSYRDAVHIRASATGDVFGLWATSHSPQGMEVMRVVGDKVETSYQHSSAGHLVPNCDGSAIHSGDAGVCTPELNRKQTNQKRVPLVPSTHPKFYLGVPAEPGAQINLGSKPFEGVKPTLHTISSDGRLIDAPPLQLGTSKENASWSRGDFTLDKRVHYIIAANQLITVPFSNDKLVIQPFDCQKEMEKADLDYLYVTSIPPRSVQPNDHFQYALEVVTNGGSPKFELSSGPKGMSIDAQGVVHWKVPASLKEDNVSVIITITTADGQSIYETFSVKNSQASKSKTIGDRRASNDRRFTGRDLTSVPPVPSRPSIAPSRPAEVASTSPADHGLEIQINPEGIFRPAVPNPAFSGGARGAVFRQPEQIGRRPSPARARMRIYNRSKNTIDALSLAVKNDLPILSRQTVTVDALRGVGQLMPGAGVEVMVNWPILPNVNLGPGGASIEVTVANISTK